MIYPKFLKDGDLIDVPAPSDGSSDDLDIKKVKNAKKKLEDLSYKVNLSKYIFCSKAGRSSNEINRAQELNEMFSSKSNCIICGGGGDFLIEILPYINFENLVKNPKWVQGFSDPTGILFPITTKYDIATIYSNNFKSFGAEVYHKSLEDNLEILKGNLIKQESYELYENERMEKITGLEGYNLTEKVEWKTLDDKPINVTGRIIAGCLDLISELSGTKYDGMKDFNEKYKNDGIILAFDNCELSKEELLRTIWKLNEFEYFKYAKCVIFGRNGLDKNYYQEYQSMKNCLEDSIINKLNIPIIYDADISHKSPSMTIINGSIAHIECNNGKGNISFELK